MAGLKQIAEKTGVSIRTVSRALNKDKYVRSELRKRILAVAEELQYRPNKVARSLRTQRSFIIDLVLHQTDEMVMARAVGFGSILRQNNFRVCMHLQPDNDPDNLLDDIISQNPAGVGLIAHPRDQTVFNRLKSSNIPAVVIGNASTNIDHVCADRVPGIREAVLHLAATGRKHIAYLGHPEPETEPTAQRLDGYHQGMREAGLTPCIIPTARYGEQYNCGRQVVGQLLQLNPVPDAVLCFTDFTAFGVLGGLHDRGLKIPDDIAVVGFNGITATLQSSPPLTTIAYPNREMGETAAEILLARIQGDPEPAGGWSRVLPTKLIVRESTEG